MERLDLKTGKCSIKLCEYKSIILNTLDISNEIHAKDKDVESNGESHVVLNMDSLEPNLNDSADIVTVSDLKSQVESDLGRELYSNNML